LLFYTFSTYSYIYYFLHSYDCICFVYCSLGRSL
jgi:hypothetical protein